MKSLKTILITVLFAALALTANGAPKQGDIEASIALGGRGLSDADSMTVLTTRLDIYYTNLLLVGARVDLGLGDDTAYTGGVEALYNFPIDEKLKLFAGANFGTAAVDIEGDDDLSLKFAGLGGARYAIDDHISVYGELEVGAFVVGVSERFVGINIGVTYQF